MSDDNPDEAGSATNGGVSTDGRGSGTLNRRRYLGRTGALAAAAVGLSGCTGSGASGGSDGGSSDESDGSSSDGSSGGSTGTTVGNANEDYEPVVFIETPGNQPENTRKQWKPFTEYLLSEVDGLEMEINFAQSYSAVGQAMMNGRGHISAGDVVLLANPNEFDVLGLQSSGGSSVYFSFVVTRPTYEGIDELTDLKGKTIGFADRLSTSGSLFATYALKQAGLDIGEAPQGDPVDYTGEWSNHDAAKGSLFNREDVVAIGTYAGNIIEHIPREQIPQIVRDRSAEWSETVGSKTPEAELLHHSPPIPKEPLIAPSDWEHPLRADIEEAILSIEPGTLRKPEGVDLPITAVSEGSIEDFEPVRNVIDELGIEFGNL
jgi:phosphonate transport system substrate-binding protein